MVLWSQGSFNMNCVFTDSVNFKFLVTLKSYLSNMEFTRKIIFFCRWRRTQVFFSS